jgi:peroxin-6
VDQLNSIRFSRSGFLLTAFYRFTLHPSVSLQAVAQQLPFTYTGADFYALCSDAMLKAVTRQASGVDTKIKAINADPKTKHEISTANFFDHYASPEDIAVMVTEQDFIEADRELIPSVSAGELAHYERVRATFEGGRDKQTKPSNGVSLVTRTFSGSSASSRPTSKGKGKAVSTSVGKGKGKALVSSDDDDYGVPLEDGMKVNGRAGKGKGKAVAGFQEGTASDDDGLY